MAGQVKYLNDQDFKNSIAKGVTLVDFFAEWCGPCRMVAPVVDEMSQELEGKAQIAKLDIDNAQSVASEFEITSVPTIIVFKDGQEFSRVIGVRGKEELMDMVNKAMA